MAVKTKTTRPGTVLPISLPAAKDIRSSRHMAGLSVAVAVVAAAGLLIVANAIFGRLNWRVDLETLGRYGLSPSAKRILDETDAKITLTSIYTSTKPDQKAEDFLPRLRDLLLEIGQYDADVTVVNVTSDRQKAEVLGRLRNRLNDRAKDHRKVITDFQGLVNTQGPQYERMAERWERYPAEGWLTQFGLGKTCEAAFKGNKAELDRTAAELRAKLAGSTLADYPEMVEQIRTTLARIKSRLEQVAGHLRQLKGLPENATKASAGLKKTVSELTSAMAKMVAVVGTPDSDPPADPSAVLDKLAVQATAAATAAEKALDELMAFNKDNGRYVQFAESWRVGGRGLPQLAMLLGHSCKGVAEQALGIRDAAKVKIQKEYVVQLRAELPRLAAGAGSLSVGLAKLLAELTKLDKDTQAAFATADKGEYLKDLIDPAKNLIERIERIVTLDKLTDQKELIEQINQDNIVLVEIVEKVKKVEKVEKPVETGEKAGPQDAVASKPPRRLKV
ncbi:hypothetical protein LCGC14_2230550, partial [marine sediment metagenome]